MREGLASIFVYLLGPYRIKIIFHTGTEDILEKTRTWYKDFISNEVSDMNSIHHTCNIEFWRNEELKFPIEKEEVSWLSSHEVLFSSIEGILINIRWSEDYAISYVGVVQDRNIIYHGIPENYFWEAVQRFVIIPYLIANKTIFLHCGAIIKNGFAHVFLGENGAGKTTLIQIAQRTGYEIITDDTALLAQKDGRFLLTRSSYLSKSAIVGKEGIWPIKKFYLLSKNSESILNKASRSEFVTSLNARFYETFLLRHIFTFGELGKKVERHITQSVLLCSRKYCSDKLMFSLDIPLEKYIV